MAVASAALPLFPKTLCANGKITSIGTTGGVISIYVKTFAGLYEDTFFVGWGIYTIRKSDNTLTPPRGLSGTCTVYTGSTGHIEFVAYTGLPTVGDELYLIHPSIVNTLTAGTATLSSGTYVQPNDIVEHNVLSFTSKGIIDTTLFMANVTQRYIVREYDQESPGLYRLASYAIYPDDFPVGCMAIEFHFVSKPAIALMIPYLITLQALGLEGAVRDINYNYMIQLLI